jgi:hypothetical protein
MTDAWVVNWLWGTAVAVLWAAFWWWLVRPYQVLYKRLRARYWLYPVRDRLILLVATGKAREDDELFQHYYQGINRLLRYTPRITLGLFLEALRDWPESDGREAAEIARSLRGRSLEFREVVADLYGALLNVLADNSTFIRLVFSAPVRAAMRRGIRNSFTSGPALSPLERHEALGHYREAYRRYQAFEQAKETALATAAAV